MAEDLRQRLRQAAQARISLEHPNLLPARAERDRNGRIALRLRQYSAPTLSEVLSSGPLTVRDSLRVLHGVASAVDALGRAGLVARDLNPDHILVCPRRGGILADLAISPELLPRAARADDRNYAYRSPEERALLPIDIRSNVYSLGAVFLATQTARNGARVAVPAAVQAVVKRAMAIEPERRSFSPKEFIDALASAAGLLRQRAAVRDRPAADRRKAASPAAAQRARPPKTPPTPAPVPAPVPVRAASPQPEAASRPKPRRSRPRLRLPALGAAMVAAKARLPRPSLPRPSMPRLSAPSVPRPRLPALPRMHLPSVPRPRLPALPRMHLPSVPRPRLPALPRFSAPSLPRPQAPARVPLVAVPLGLAVAGFFLVGMMLGKASEDGAEASQIKRSSFTLRLPSNWGETQVARTSGVELSTPVAAAPFGEGGAGLVVGRVRDIVALDKRFRSEGERTDARLGRLEAWRYAGLEPGEKLVATAYLAPTTGDPLLVICHARQGKARARLPQCEEIASSIALRGARPASLEQIAQHQKRLDMVMASLGRERQDARRRLANVTLAADQAEAARQLEGAYREAATRLAKAEPPRGAAALDDLVRSLRATANAYGRLADAAGEADRAGYREASEAITKGEEAVDTEAMAAA